VHKLDTGSGATYLRSAVWNIPFRIGISTPMKKHMGSTPYGNVDPMLIGTALPQDAEIGRDGNGRVRVRDRK
jgi:hypothetical protein